MESLFVSSGGDVLHFALLLLIGHMLGDFFLQSTALLKWKEKSLLGIGAHVLVLFAVTLFVTFPYIIYNNVVGGSLYVILAVLFIHLMHFGIDFVKIRLSKKFVQYSWGLFVIDQLLHILIILIVAFACKNVISVRMVDSLFSELYITKSLVGFVALLLFVTYPIEVVKFVYKLNTSRTKAGFAPNVRAMCIRGTLVSLLFSCFLFFPVVANAASYDTDRTARVDSITPTVVNFNDEVVIKGVGFGNERTKYSQVCISDICIANDSFTLWSDNEIRFKMNVIGLPSQGVMRVLRLNESGLYTESVTGENVSIMPTIEGFYDNEGNRLDAVVAGQNITVKGYYFGTVNGMIKLDKINVSSIRSWSQDTINFTVPELKIPTKKIYITRKNSLTTEKEIHGVSGSSNDKYSYLQTYLFDANVANAWMLAPKLGSGVIVAVIDDGVDAFHPDLDGSMFRNEKEIVDDGKDNDNNGYIDDVSGYNFHDKNADMTPHGNHGTLVAGIVAAKKDNGIGIAGIAPNVKILPLIACDVKVCSAQAVDKAVRYAVSMGAKVINLSLTELGDNPTFEKNFDATMKFASDAGVIVVVAAGNGNTSLAKAQEFYGRNFNVNPVSPACNNGDANFVIGVASIRSDLSNSRFSDYGSNCIDVSAYGENVYGLNAVSISEDSLVYQTASGTSFATPQVSAAFALAFSMFPNVDVSVLKLAMRDSGKSLGENMKPEFAGQFGNGLDIALFLERVTSLQTLTSVKVSEKTKQEKSDNADVTVAKNSEFADVFDNHKNVKAIHYLKEKKILSGYSDGSFRPNGLVNRAELLKILIAGEGMTPDPVTYKDCFDDVSDEWFASYVCYAKERGWVQGYSDGTFRPSTEVNKVEALKMMFAVYGLNVSNENAPYKDVRAEVWYAPYISAAIEMNLLEEKGALYHPSRTKTRAALAENVYRILKMREENVSNFSNNDLK